MQDQLDKKEYFLCITVKKPIVSHSPKSSWEHMLHNEMQKLFAWKSTEFCLTGLALNVLERDLSIVV